MGRGRRRSAEITGVGRGMSYFKNPNFREAQGTVVGHINSLSIEERWEEETRLFGDALMRHIPQGACSVLDYGCGIGRVSKELLKRDPQCTILGVDNSDVQLAHASSYISDPRFRSALPEQVEGEFDFAFSLFVIQHVRAVHLRQALQIIHAHLKPGALFAHCCSVRRMAVRNDAPRFFDDRFLGVNMPAEIELLFEPLGDLFSPDEMKRERTLRKIVLGETGEEEPGSLEVLGEPHPARLYRRRELSMPYWRLPML